MQKFIQYTPTEILFGENTQEEVGKEVKKWGGSRVFIVYGGNLKMQHIDYHRSLLCYELNQEDSDTSCNQ